MENLQDLFYTYIPPSLLGKLTTHTSTYYRAYSYLLQARNLVMATLNKTLNPLLTRLLHEPDIASFLLLLIILYISMKILDMLWRTAIYWARLLLRLAVFASVLVLAYWAWNRGLEGVAKDLKYVAAIWRSEYAGWKKRSEMARVKSQVRDGGWMQRGRWG